MCIPKRNIAEIRTRYELEPDLDDVYLEGVYDKEVLDAAMKDTPELFRPCYAIDDIYIDGSLLAKYNLTTGNRQRVIVLASELDLPLDTSVRLIVDRDFEDWLPTLPRKSGLVTTKYCDLEIVFFYDEFVKKVMVDASRCKIPEWDNFFDALKVCLCELYCVRLEFEASKIGSPLIKFTRCVKLVEGNPILNISDLIERSLSRLIDKNSRNKLSLKVLNRICELKKEPHQFVARGHDLITLLAWCIRKTKGDKSFQSEETITRLLVLFAESNRSDLLYPLS